MFDELDIAQKLRQQIDLLKEEVKFSKKQVMILVVLALLMAGAGYIANRQSQGLKTVEVSKSARKRPVSKKKQPKTFHIHLGGEVKNPGLYRLTEDARVADAIAAAGGATESGDIDRINLALKLRDEQKIVVPSVGSSKSATGFEIEDGLGDGGRINLNTATSEQLEELNGIGPHLAAKIIDWRQKNGGFRRVEQLEQVSGIGPKKLETIREDVVAD